MKISEFPEVIFYNPKENKIFYLSEIEYHINTGRQFMTYQYGEKKDEKFVVDSDDIDQKKPFTSKYWPIARADIIGVL